jgi:hypothetical protein
MVVAADQPGASAGVSARRGWAADRAMPVSLLTTDRGLQLPGMSDVTTPDELKRRRVTTPTAVNLCALYWESLRSFGLRALWISPAADDPTIADRLALPESLRVDGCRAAFWFSLPGLHELGSKLSRSPQTRGGSGFLLSALLLRIDIGFQHGIHPREIV